MNNINLNKKSFILILLKIFSILYVIPLCLIIGSLGGALYGYAYSIILVLTVFSTTGISFASSKLITKYNNDLKILNISKYIMYVINLIVFLILLIFSNNLANYIVGDLYLVKVEDMDFVIKASAFYILFTTPISIYKGYVEDKELNQSLSLADILEGIIKAVLITLSTLIGLKVFNLELKYLILLILTSSFIASLISSIYLKVVIVKFNKKRIIKSKIKVDKKLINLIINYSVPFILLDLFNSISTGYDSLYLVKVLVNNFKYNIYDAYEVFGILSFYARYLNELILVFISGIIAYVITNKRYKTNEQKINKSLQLVLFIGLPIIVIISILSGNIWNVFYGKSEFGSVAFGYYIFLVFFYVLFLICSKNLIELKEYKFLYIIMFIGLLINISLKMPLLEGLNKMGLPAYYGSITSIILGYFIPVLISLIFFNLKYKINYENTIKVILDIIMAILVLAIVLVLLKIIIPINSTNRFINLIILIVEFIIGMIVYFFVSIKNGVIYKILDNIGGK
ncbi:MAG: oligosaccharide flippase family protein [Bacilli bacterium]|nr:oligosaccharide flippase family protein [Bacilli bacterium]